jgi:hypothetical protein
VLTSIASIVLAIIAMVLVFVEARNRHCDVRALIRLAKRQQETIAELQRHAAAMEQGAVDERTALISLSQRLSDRGVIDASELPADAAETTH